MTAEKAARFAYGEGESAAAEPAPLPLRAPRLPEEDFVAVAASSRELAELARRVAQSECSVLIAGESGTGKEVLARFIHRQSPRRNGPFVAVNCAAIPEHMLEAILFGYERGAFTGAHTAHPGKFEQAQGGTLLLDEITEMPLGLQAKLLRVIQEREVERLGGRGPLALDVRLLATTNRRLRAEVAAGRFREDLFYRLNVFPLSLSPLRERRDDVLPLAVRLLAQRCRPGQRVPAISADAAHLLLTYPWPGNVRELDNLMQRALVLVNGPVVEAEHIPFEACEALEPAAPAEAGARAAPVTGAGGSAAADIAERGVGDLAHSIEHVERELILQALRADHGSRQAAAQRLGISPRTLRYKLARLRDSGFEVPA